MNIDNIISERTKTCGNFPSIAGVDYNIKTSMRAGEKWAVLPPYMEIALSMISHKLARITSGDPYYKDHWTDIIGYSELVLRELESREQMLDNIVKGG